MYLYTLKLKDNCWYVGTTTDLRSRFQQHLNGYGAEWTKKHKPIEISTKYPVMHLPYPHDVCRLEEGKQVKRIMMDVGIEKVRGGSYLRSELSYMDVRCLAKEIYHAKNGCLRCGRRNHWASACFATSDVTGNIIIDDDEINGNPKISEDFRVRNLNSSGRNDSKRSVEHYHARNGCLRCGRLNHQISACFATFDVAGNIIVDDDETNDETRIPQDFRVRNLNSAIKNDSERSFKRAPVHQSHMNGTGDVCYRCGRIGHWVNSCYAVKDVNGNIIIDD